MPSLGEVIYYVVSDGPPLLVLLRAMDWTSRKFRYPLKWVFVAMLVANLASIAASRLLRYSGILGTFAA